jgi:hypothetical protein
VNITEQIINKKLPKKEHSILHGILVIAQLGELDDLMIVSGFHWVGKWLK